jgi:hypothetical protein
MPYEKSFEEVLMHSVAGLAPIEVVTLSDFLPPKSVVMRVGFERREDMVAPTALKNINTMLVENGAVLQSIAKQAPCGLHARVYGLYHVLFPYFR